MKPLKFLTLSLAFTAGLIACDPIHGTLQVDRSFSIKTGSAQNCPADMYPCPENVKLATVNPGSYTMDVDALGKDTVRIYLKADRKQHNVELSVPNGKSIPSTGSFSLSSSESGQPFDLAGQTQTDVSQSPEYSGQESCQIPETRRVCGVKEVRPGRPPVHTCWDEIVYRDGIEDVRYYDRTETQVMQAVISQSGAQVAHYSGSRTSTDRIYTYRSGCRPRYPW